MPNSSNVDERVVQMRMDNEQFEKGAKKTMDTLDKLEKSLDFKKEATGFNLSPLEKSVDAIKDKFSALQIFGKRVVENIADTTVDLAKQALVGVDQIRPGYAAYEEQVAAIQKMMIATGESMSVVQDMSDKILLFTDETSYNYKSMLDTIASFTSSGRGLKESESAVLGMAIAAAQAGVDANSATHAFTGFQRAIAQGYMGSAQWQWIKTAGMNSAMLKEALIDAAIATGDLHKEADGITYAYEQTAKGVKKTAVTLQNFDSSFSEKWLSSETLLKGLKGYSVAFEQMYDVHKETGMELYEIMQDMGDQFDQYSFKAFEAGQVTKTFTEAINAVKSATKSGWMKSFELLIGNFEQAKGFYSELIEPLWNIFVEPGNQRNKFLEAAFGGGAQKQKQTVINWEKLATKITEAGKETKDLNDAFKKVTGASQDAKIKALSSEFETLEDAIKAGAVEGDLLKKILEEIGINAKSSTDEATAGAEKATKAFQEYREVAMGVLRGDYGNGQERKDRLAELGYDYDTIQWLAGNLEWLHQNGWAYEAISDEYLLSLPKFENVQQILDGLNGSVENTTDSYFDLNEVMDETDKLLNEAAGMSGRELWQQSVLNIVNMLAEAFGKLGEAFDEVFGDAKSRGEGFRGWLVRIWEFTERIKTGESALESVKNVGITVFSVLKNGLSNLGIKIRVVGKSIKLVFGVVSDLISGVFDLFKGKLELPKQLQNTDSFLGRILTFLNTIFGKVSEFFKNGSIWSVTENLLDKLEEVRQSFKNGKSIPELLKGLFGKKGEGIEGGGILDSLLEFFKIFKKDSEGIADTVGQMSKDIGGLTTAIGGVSEVGGNLYDAVFGDQSKSREKISGFWTTVKETFITEYGKINWDTLFDVGRLGLIGFMIYRMNETFKSLKGLLNGPKGILDIINKFQSNLTSPLTALSKAITKHEESDRYFKIAASIGILASSLYLLAKVPEQQLFNVAVTLGFLFMIMSQLAKNMSGFQLFSNNSKTISKDNPVSLFANTLQSLKQAFAIDFTGATANISLLPKTMGTLLGIAAVITSFVYAIIKLKDIAKPGEIEQLIPTFIILGGVMSAMVAAVGIMAALTEKSKYIGKAGGTMVALAASILLIVNYITKIGKLSRDDLDWTAMLVMFGMMIVILGAIALVLKAAGRMTNQGQSAITSGSAVWGVAGVMIAIALMIKSLVKTMAKASEIENLNKGVVLVLGLFLALVAVFTVLSLIVSENKFEPKEMLKLAASMVILALAVDIMVPAIMIMAALPAKGLIGAAGAIAILVMSMSAAMWILGQLDTKKMLIAAGAFALLSLGMSAMIGTIGLLAIAFVGLMTAIKWEELTDRTDAFAQALEKIWKPLLGVGAAVFLLGAGLLFASIGLGIVGVSFVLITGGLFLAALALEHFGKSLTTIGEGLPAFAKGLTETFDHLGTNWNWAKALGMLALLALAIFAVKKAVSGLDLSNIDEKTKDLGPKLVSGIQNIIKALQLASPQLVKAFLSLGVLAITALALMVPFAVRKLVEIIVTIVRSLAEALNTNADQLISAFTQLFLTLVNIAFKAFTTVIGSFFDLIWNFILEVIRAFGGDRLAGLMEKVVPANWFDMSADTINAAADRALQKSVSNLKPVEPIIDVKPKAEVSSMLNDPQLNAELEALESEFASSGSSAGTAYGDSAGGAVSTALETSLLGGEEGGGIPGVLNNVMGNVGSYMDPTMLTSSIGGVLSETFTGEEMTGIISGAGQSNGLALTGGIAAGAGGEQSTITLQNAATSAFNTFGNQFGTDSENGSSILGNNTIVGLYNSLIEKAKEYLPGAGSYSFSQYSSGYSQAADQHSPSREMMKYGRFTIMGLAQGLVENANLAYNAGDKVGLGLMNEFQMIMQKVATIADEDFTITPTISPVVDMTNIEAASSRMNGTFGQGITISAQMTGSINRRMNEVERVASNMEARSQTINNTGDNFTFNIYASEGMDENAIADAVMNRMQTRMVRRGAAFG